jgi:patatin-like phospholipase/acyl hydrolase
MKRILSIDGGGAMGIIPLTVLKEIEAHMRKPICELFDLITGTSIGAAIGGVLSTGTISCEKLHATMILDFGKIFKRRLRFPIFQPKYKTSNIRAALDSYIKGMKMYKCKTKFFCTSINYIDGRNHFFKSWEDKDGQLDLTTAIIRSGSAPLFFGKSVDKANREVWIDGGTGNMNDPTMQAYIEACRQGWFPNEEVFILSLGCGQSFKGVPYKKCRKFNNIQEVSFFMNIMDGGLARAQISKTQEIWLQTLADANKNFYYQRVQEYALPKRINKLDGIKYIPEYLKIGKKLAEEIKYPFMWGQM